MVKIVVPSLLFLKNGPLNALGWLFKLLENHLVGGLIVFNVTTSRSLSEEGKGKLATMARRQRETDRRILCGPQMHD